ncbi:MAG: hypothetical protein AAFR39_11755 [Pseudomonadota bacterium]
MQRSRIIPSAGTWFAAIISGILGLLWTSIFMFGWFGWQNPVKISVVGLFYGMGLSLGLLVALQLDRLFMTGLKRRWLRLSLLLIVAVVLVIGFTAGLLAIQYRFYYAQWHEPFLSRTWMFQLFFTTLGAVAQYGIFGIRYHGVGALLIILATCWWATRTSH